MSAEQDLAVQNQESIRKIVAKLKAIDTFSLFSDQDLEEHFLPLCKVAVYQPGDSVIREGDVDTLIFFLIQGQVKVLKQNEEVFQLKRTGDVFGEVTAIDGSPRSASVVAVKPTTCLAMDSSRFKNISPEAREKFLATLHRVFAQKLAERLRSANAHIARLKDENERLRRRLGEPAPSNNA
jgi:CRP-like cAMP-binding protein